MSIRLSPEYGDVVALNERIVKKLEGLASLLKKDSDHSDNEQEILRVVQEAQRLHTETKQLLEKI